MSHFLKKFWVLLLIVFINLSCEEVIEVDVPETPPRLVVEATFNRFFSGPNPRAEGIVKLSLTAPFFANEIPPALGAEVFINDPVTGISFFGDDRDNNGNYLFQFTPEFDKEYTLTINYEGETYQSSTEMIGTGELVSLKQGTDVFLNEEDKGVIIEIQDDPSERNFYFYDLGFGNFLTAEDEFFAENVPFTLTYYYEDLEIGDFITVKLLGVEESFVQFFGILQGQSGELGTAGPFATPPATVRGNVVNITNPQNFPFGYFRISEGSEMSIVITE